MKFLYDEQANALYVSLAIGPVEETIPFTIHGKGEGDLFADFDDKGNLLGVEMLNASLYISRPRLMEHCE